MAEFNSGRPYCAIAGELVADAIALLELVRARRPETIELFGALHVAFDARARVVLVGLQQDDGAVVLIERILVDPSEPARFGESELPTVTEKISTH